MQKPFLQRLKPVEREEKSIESVGEGIMVGAGFAVGGLGGSSFSLCVGSP